MCAAERRSEEEEGRGQVGWGRRAWWFVGSCAVAHDRSGRLHCGAVLCGEGRGCGERRRVMAAQVALRRQQEAELKKRLAKGLLKFGEAAGRKLGGVGRQPL
ncbi:hypothetical protein scyTo_0021092, partial [Scyliorhinus torazame]|nr:hypothetical protein [Scyliorhinus torazame]